MNPAVNLKMFIEEAVQLELNVSSLYMLFHENFPDDRTFWWDLALEEKNHASIIRSAEMIAEAVEEFPVGIMPASQQELEKANAYIRSLIERFTQNPPLRSDAFNTAYKLEHSAGELHFQNYMNKTFGSSMEELFKKLNQEDKNHAIRIKTYMKKNGIEIK